MARQDNPHAQRLSEAIRTHLNEEAAASFMQAHPLSASADAPRKFAWAQHACDWLAEHANEETARCIRRDCRCGDGRTMAQEIRTCISKAGSLEGGCARFTEKNKYAFLEYVNDHELRFGYHACVCSCVKRAADTLPLLWCECSCGYAEAMLRQVFGEGVQVALRNSVKAGDPRCEMRITIP